MTTIIVQKWLPVTTIDRFHCNVFGILPVLLAINSLYTQLTVISQGAASVVYTQSNHLVVCLHTHIGQAACPLHKASTHGTV